MTKDNRKKLHFEVSSGLKSVLGRDLITNDYVAIFELVKNSIDAGADNIDIVYEKNKDNSKLYIIDNGKGMSIDDIENKWLFLAYSAKQDGTEDVVAKKYAGNKGIGRLSCDRLGAKLKIQSKIKKSNHVEVLEVEWGEFEKNTKEKFTNIDVYSSQEKCFDLPADILYLDCGVIIEISQLREPESWDRKKLIGLKRDLVKLINPFGVKSNDFQIKLHANNELTDDKKIKEKSKGEEIESVKVVNGPVENNILDVLETKTTSLSVSLENNCFYSELVDRGEMIYKIKEPIDFGSSLKDTTFSCNIYSLNNAAKTTFSRRMGFQPIEFGSLFLFRNGFRVYPIGNENDDFWGIARRKQQGYARYFGYRDILGRIDISGPESKFKEASSRDLGLVKTNASEELKSIVMSKVIRRLEAYVTGILWGDKIDQSYETIERVYLDEARVKVIDLVEKLSASKNIELLAYNENLINVLNEKSKHFEPAIEKLAKFATKSGSKELLGLVKLSQDRFEQENKRAKEAIRQADEELKARREAESLLKEVAQEKLFTEKELSKTEKILADERKRNLFLIKSENRDVDQLESFIHQLIIYASSTGDILNDAIISLSKKESYSKSEVLDVLREVLHNNEKIIATSRFATSAAFMLDSAQLEDDLCLYIKGYLENISGVYNQRVKITIELDDSEFSTRFSPIEIGMIFDNLISNAQKAKASKVNVSIFVEHNNMLLIKVTDNGRGLSPSILEKNRIFEKGYTTTDGSGLGLHHSKKTLEDIGGEIALSESQPTRGTEFIIRIKK